MPSPFPNLHPDLRGRVHSVVHASDALRGNFWNDPDERELLVYTPPGYDESRRYPALLVLPGYGGTGEGLLARGLSDMSLATRIDRLIRDGCPPFVAVLPDVMTSLGGSQYVDSPALGNYATYVADELPAFVESQFATNGRWGVAGRSSGGFGALHLAMTRPGRFQAVASHAGDMGFDACYLAEVAPAIAALSTVGGPGPLLQRFWREERPSASMFSALSMLCLSAAYAPDVTRSPFPARLPFDWEEGVVDLSALSEWRVHDPVVRADDPEALRGLRELRYLLVDAGDRDEYLLHLGARRFVRKLRQHGVAHDHEEHPGGHRGTAWRYDVSLPRLAQVLA